MPAKPASIAGGAPASETKVKKATKTSTTTNGEAKKKRRKTRKETYSFYIYKGTRSRIPIAAICQI